MADSTTNLDQIAQSQAQKEVTANELFDAHSPASFGGRRGSACSGLTWAYYGGRWGGSSVANGTVTLRSESTNYITANRSTGAIELDSSSPGAWNDTTNFARLYKVTTGSVGVSSYEDHRMGPGGLFAGEGSTSGGTTGRHSIPVMASGMGPSASGGCAAIASIATSSGQPDIQTLNFDASTDESAQFSIPMPKRWNRGTVTARFIWSHSSTTTNFAVVWGLQAVAIGNDDAIGASFGTAQTVTDTGGTTNDLYTTDETAAITIAGTPQAEDMVFFKVYRDADNGSDTLAVDARLHAVVLYITTDAENDA